MAFSDSRSCVVLRKALIKESHEEFIFRFDSVHLFSLKLLVLILVILTARSIFLKQWDLVLVARFQIWLICDMRLLILNTLSNDITFIARNSFR